MIEVKDEELNNEKVEERNLGTNKTYVNKTLKRIVIGSLGIYFLMALCSLYLGFNGPEKFRTLFLILGIGEGFFFVVFKILVKGYYDYIEDPNSEEKNIQQLKKNIFFGKIFYFFMTSGILILLVTIVIPMIVKGN